MHIDLWLIISFFPDKTLFVSKSVVFENFLFFSKIYRSIVHPSLKLKRQTFKKDGTLKN